MQESHTGYDVVVRIATHAIHVLDHDGVTVQEHIVRPPVDVLSRFGDPTPVRIDPAGRMPADIVADALAETFHDAFRSRRVLALVPDSWGPHRCDLLAHLISELGGTAEVRGETSFIFDHSDAPVDCGTSALWVRVGSEATIAALVQHTANRWIFTHRVDTSWGGDDIDDELVGFVRRRLPDATSGEQLRVGCREARETLSHRTTAGVASSSGGVHLHRKDVEDLAGDAARAALGATLGQVLALCEASTDTVLLTGGAGRTPLLAQLASEVSGRPVRLIDWRDTVGSVLARPATPSTSPTLETTAVPVPASSSPPISPGRDTPSRRKGTFVGLVTAGVALVAFAVVSVAQPSGAGILRGVFGDGGPTVPGGRPPGAYAATQSAAPVAPSDFIDQGRLDSPISAGTADYPQLMPGLPVPSATPNAAGAPGTPGVTSPTVTGSQQSEAATVPGTLGGPAAAAPVAPAPAPATIDPAPQPPPITTEAPSPRTEASAAPAEARALDTPTSAQATAEPTAATAASDSASVDPTP